MRSRRGRIIGLGLIVVPIVVAIAAHYLGSDPVAVRVEGPAVHPTNASVNIQDYGVILVLAVLAGLLWLVSSFIAQLFAKHPRDEDNA